VLEEMLNFLGKRHRRRQARGHEQGKSIINRGYVELAITGIILSCQLPANYTTSDIRDRTVHSSVQSTSVPPLLIQRVDYPVIFFHPTSPIFSTIPITVQLKSLASVPWH